MMNKFTFKKTTEKNNQNPVIKDGVYPASIAQVANIGLQRPFDREDDPEEQMAVAFELPSGELVARRMKFSSHPSSGCYSLFTSAFPDIGESDEDLGLPELLGKSVLIEIEVRGGKWPRVVEIMPLEDGFEPVTPKTDLLVFDAHEMDREIFLKLHRDIRSWFSKRVRHS